METTCCIHVHATDKPKLQVIGFNPVNGAVASPRSVLDPRALTCAVNDNHVIKGPRSVLGTLFSAKLEGKGNDSPHADGMQKAGAEERESQMVIGQPNLSDPVMVNSGLPLVNKMLPKPPPAYRSTSRVDPSWVRQMHQNVRATPIFSTSSPFVSPSSSTASGVNFFDDQALDFLRTCFLCKRGLGAGKDIYMYRGDRAFCSSECRHHQILLDEHGAKWWA